VTITPDDKDWTWVLERRCPECGFDAATFDVAATGSALRANAAEWRALLTDVNASDRTRDDRWSVLEYACHVRDASRIYLMRLDRMLTEDGPRYANWDQDETAIADRYCEQSPDQVADELAGAAEDLAIRFDAVRDDEWSRTGFRGDGAAFTIDSFARYFVHDPIHHVWDVTEVRVRNIEGS